MSSAPVETISQISHRGESSVGIGLARVFRNLPPADY